MFQPLLGIWKSYTQCIEESKQSYWNQGPVNVSWQYIYHSTGSGQCKYSWKCHDSKSTLGEAEALGYRQCFKCHFEKKSPLKILIRRLTHH
jgi:hypothetical protein